MIYQPFISVLNHRFILKPYKGPASRNTCPQCNQKHMLSRYIDTTTGNELADHCGRCNREDSCGYHFKPRELKMLVAHVPIQQIQEPIKPVSYLPFDVFETSVMNHRQCDLYPFLVSLVGEETASDLCNEYFIGASKHGNTCFWQTDVNANIRQCKIIQYLPNGHRDKSKTIVFAGKKILNNQDANLQQCFFGEYLLSFPENYFKPVGIVESEKSAAIASIFYPKYVWLATGGINGCKWTEQSVSKVLQSREIVLFPDVNAFGKWKEKGALLQAVTGSKVVISDYLENNATDSDRAKGIDIADYIISKREKVNLGQKGSILKPQ